MVKILCKHNIDEVLNNPNQYVDEEQDLALVQINDVIIMLGVDSGDKWYFVVEDNEVSEYRYLDSDYSEVTLAEAFNLILKEFSA